MDPGSARAIARRRRLNALRDARRPRNDVIRCPHPTPLTQNPHAIRRLQLRRSHRRPGDRRAAHGRRAARRSARAGEARRQRGAFGVRARRAPPARFHGLRDDRGARRDRRADESDPPRKCRHDPRHRRPRARVRGIRDARFALGRARRDHRGPRHLHGILSAVRLERRRPGRAVLGKSRAADAAERVPARDLAGKIPRTPSRTRRSRRGPSGQFRSGSAPAARPRARSARGSLGCRSRSATSRCRRKSSRPRSPPIARRERPRAIRACASASRSIFISRATAARRATNSSRAMRATSPRIRRASTGRSR